MQTTYVGPRHQKARNARRNRSNDATRANNVLTPTVDPWEGKRFSRFLKLSWCFVGRLSVVSEKRLAGVPLSQIFGRS
jgi:hypothetical protein